MNWKQLLILLIRNPEGKTRLTTRAVELKFTKQVLFLDQAEFVWSSSHYNICLRLNPDHFHKLWYELWDEH